MKRTLFGAGCLVLSGMAAAQHSGDELLALQPMLHRAIDRVGPSMVTVETFGGVRKVLAGGPAATDCVQRPKKKQPDDKKKDEKKGLQSIMQQGFLQSQGATTGVVLSEDGWIVVSRFALNYDPTTILVTLPDGRSFNAERKGEDQSRGIALLRIPVDGLPVPEWTPKEDVHVGAWAFALGRTFGRDRPSVHVGIVSARDRIFGRAVQIDANTSPANYGGPTVGLDGRVIGITVPLSPAGRDAGADWYDIEIGFAVTIADIAPLLERMREGEVLQRGWLGVSTQPIHKGPGAKIAKVVPGSTAAGIGLKAKDVVLEVNGTKVRHHFHLQVLIGSYLAEDPVHLKIDRQGDEFGLTAFLSPPPIEERKPEGKGRVDDPLPWEQGGQDGKQGDGR